MTSAGAVSVLICAIACVRAQRKLLLERHSLAPLYNLDDVEPIVRDEINDLDTLLFDLTRVKKWAMTR